MAKKGKHPGNTHARPIRTRRDHQGASAVVRQLSRAGRDSNAEQRLQALLRATEKFEEEDDALDSVADGYDYSGPHRRWSDNTSDIE